MTSPSPSLPQVRLGMDGPMIAVQGLGCMDDIVPVATELGVTLVPYSPLDRGLLTGSHFGTTLAPDDARRHFPRFAPDNRDANAALVARIEDIAAALAITPAQLALAWLHNQAAHMGTKAVPIPGTRRRTRLTENLAAATLQLDPDIMDALAPIAQSVEGAAV